LSGVPSRAFLVALNPDPDSSLPYLLRIPVDGGLELKARERWPTTAKAYCHPVDEWPAGAEVMVDGSIRGDRLRPLGLWWSAARGRESR